MRASPARDLGAQTLKHRDAQLGGCGPCSDLGDDRSMMRTRPD
jgi:hypothetical protein